MRAIYSISISVRGLKQLNRIAIRIFQLDLFPTGPHLHPIAKMNPRVLQSLGQLWKIGHLEYHPVPSARLLRSTVGHEARTGGSGTTEDQFEMPDRNLTESWQRLLIYFEPKMLSVEGDRPTHILDLVSHSPQSQDETVSFSLGVLHRNLTPFLSPLSFSRLVNAHVFGWLPSKTAGSRCDTAYLVVTSKFAISDHRNDRL
jgi:hypothetical protein